VFRSDLKRKRITSERERTNNGFRLFFRFKKLKKLVD